MFFCISPLKYEEWNEWIDTSSEILDSQCCNGMIFINPYCIFSNGLKAKYIREMNQTVRKQYIKKFFVQSNYQIYICCTKTNQILAAAVPTKYSAKH